MDREAVASLPDTGLAALVAIASHYRIPTVAADLAREYGLAGPADELVLRRMARHLGMKTRMASVVHADRLRKMPSPAIACLSDGRFQILGVSNKGNCRLVDPVHFSSEDVGADEVLSRTGGRIILIQRRIAGAGISPTAFGLRWFIPSLVKYRKAFGDVLLASLFLQIFALVSPLFFQVVVDKVLAHRSYSTLIVLVAGLVSIGLFEALLQYLRSYALSHTTSRIDVELGKRLFSHLMRLPLSYFESRPTGQTVARVRELETVRSFLTGQGLFAVLDMLFATILIGVLFAYSVELALIVVCSVPVYFLIGCLVRPILKDVIDEKFDRAALSQQLLVETIVGIQTVKASAVEPAVSLQWEERLAGYVQCSFRAAMLAAKGQNVIQYVSKLTSALLLLFGAQAVIDGDLTVGALVAFNMIAGQVAQPILRLSQLWQDVQQMQISVGRLADVLNAVPEPRPASPIYRQAPAGELEFRGVSFRYQPDGPMVLKNIDLQIKQGEVIGIVGPSGSGKSTLTKLVQRFYAPSSGHIYIDGHDLAHVDPAWLRAHIGVVLQENMLFNRSVHDNIALANPAMRRDTTIRMARMSGADEFVGRLPQGYDTIIEERGANLSGGQRQRIAIARALAPNPPILILDEATSALDYESERIVLANMREIVRGRTVIIIAHRLATVRYCNRIIGMRNGEVVEQGTHEELIARPDGLYAGLLRLQTGMTAL